MGQSFEIYNLITFPSLQINAQFIPYYKTESQITPTGTMIGDLGIKFNKNKLLVVANSTIITLNGIDIDVKHSWEMTLDEVELRNVAKKNSFELSISTPVISISFLSKAYYVDGLEPQYHFDYTAKLNQGYQDLHG